MSLRRKLLAFLHNRKKTAEYTELAYLESTGTQWIDTGVAFQPIKAVIGVCFNSEKATRQAMGFSSYNTTYFGKSSGGTFEVGGGILLDSTVNPYEWQEVEFKHNGSISSGRCELTVDGKTVIRQNNIVGQPSNFCLFNIPNYGTTLACHCKISSAKFYNANDELIADLIPVLDKDLVPCMYDKVSGTYLPNAGTGEFNWKLPNQLECLGVDGTQWIDTGFAPSSNTRVVGGVLFDKWLGGANYAFGVYGDSANFGFNVGSARTYFNVPWYNNSGIKVSVTPSFNTVFNYDISKDGLYVNGQLFTDTLLTVEFQSQKTMFIGWCSGTTQNKMSGRIYPHKIYENDVLVHYLIPVFDENLTPCMYDLVSKEYLRNQGTGAFKGYFADGSRLVSYLESDGNQWIDTGFIPTENHKIEVVGYSSKVNTGVSLVGTRNASDYNNRLQIWSDTSGYFSARINESTFVTTHPSTVKSTIVLDIKNKNFTVNDSEAYSLNYTGSLATNNYFLFLRNNGSGGVDTNYADQVVIYSFKLWDNDNLVQYLLPVLDSSNTACMYDVVTEKHFVNQGSGSFIYE